MFTKLGRYKRALNRYHDAHAALIKAAKDARSLPPDGWRWAGLEGSDFWTLTKDGRTITIDKNGDIKTSHSEPVSAHTAVILEKAWVLMRRGRI